MSRIVEKRTVENRRSPSSIVTHVMVESAAQQVAQLAADLEADLVVVGTHGRRGVPRLLLGSVAEMTLRLAPCPVLVVRRKSALVPAPSLEPPCERCIHIRQCNGWSGVLVRDPPERSRTPSCSSSKRPDLLRQKTSLVTTRASSVVGTFRLASALFCGHVRRPLAKGESAWSQHRKALLGRARHDA